MKKSDRERHTDASTCKMMPECFEPGPYEILIGRGRRCTTHWGNERFRSMVSDELVAYRAANDCKRSKSVIIGRVLANIKTHSPSAGFIKMDAGTSRWLSLTAAASRVTIAQAFRDALNDSYRSSKRSKQAKRRVAKEDQEVVQPVAKKMKIKKEMDAGIDDGLLDMDPLPFVRRHRSNNECFMSTVQFENLFAAFTQGVNVEENPFEPIPMAAGALSCTTSMEDHDCFELFPMDQAGQTLHSNGGGAVDIKESLTTSGSFGSSTPYRIVRAAICA